MREITMTIPQFLAVQRNELTYKDLENQFKYNYKFKKALVLAIACNNILIKNVYADSNKIDIAGQTLLSTAQTIGYWACLIMCIVEIILALISHRSDDLKKICIKYVAAFSSLYFMPWVFDFIKELFGGI